MTRAARWWRGFGLVGGLVAGSLACGGRGERGDGGRGGRLSDAGTSGHGGALVGASGTGSTGGAMVGSGGVSVGGAPPLGESGAGRGGTSPIVDLPLCDQAHPECPEGTVCRLNSIGVYQCGKCGDAGGPCCDGDSCLGGGCCAESVCVREGEMCGRA